MMRQNVTFVEQRFLKKLAIDKDYGKVRDHWSYAGKYRVAAHSICNLRFA